MRLILQLLVTACWTCAISEAEENIFQTIFAALSRHFNWRTSKQADFVDEESEDNSDNIGSGGGGDKPNVLFIIADDLGKSQKGMF